MKRFAFKMYLKPGCEKEYAKRHAAIWPELKKMIKDAGVRQGNQHSVCLSRMQQRHEQPGHDRRRSHYPEMVGHDDRYYGSEP